MNGATRPVPPSRALTDALGVVIGPETLPDPAARARAAAQLADAGVGSVVQCPPGRLATLLGDVALATGMVVVHDPRRTVEPQVLPSAVAALVSTLHAVTSDGEAGVRLVAAALVGPVTDTLKQVDPGGVVRGTADRDGHAAVVAPLALAPLTLRAALAPLAGTDVGAVTPDRLLRAIIAAGGRVVAVPTPPAPA